MELRERIIEIIRNPPSRECTSHGPNGEVEGTFKAYTWEKPFPWDRYPEDIADSLLSLLNEEVKKARIEGISKGYEIAKGSINSKSCKDKAIAQLRSKE